MHGERALGRIVEDFSPPASSPTMFTYSVRFVEAGRYPAQRNSLVVCVLARDSKGGEDATVTNVESALLT